jgi:hypothetical protein
MDAETKYLYSAFVENKVVCFVSGNTKYVIFHYPQVLCGELRKKAEWADFIICCHPLDFQHDYPEYSEKSVGTWDKITAVEFHRGEITVRQLRERKDMKNKLVILKTKSSVTVVTEGEYIAKYKDFQGEIIFLGVEDEIRFPRVGIFTSDLCVFTEGESFVVVSFEGNTDQLKYDIDWRATMHQVKSLVKSSGLSFEEFMQAAYRLHQAKEL